MPVTLPFEVFEVFEKTFGKEEAKVVVKAIESTISQATEYKWKTTKEELLDAMRKEFITRERFEEKINIFDERFNTFDERFNTFDEKINTLRVELLGRMESDKAELLGRIESDKAELLGRIESDKAELLGKIEALYEKTEKDKAELLGRMEMMRVSLDRKFTIMFVILLFTIIFLNQNSLEFILKILGLIK